MRSRLLGKLKQNKAFTLMEMMITVAVIVVLLGISVIAITDWTNKLKMTELDGHAKTIYLEAQNQLAALETEGSLAKLYNGLSIEGGQYYDEYNGRKLTESPADYDVLVYGDYYKRMYFFTSDDGIMTTFIPAISVTGDEGAYLVELNPESGDVYGVFYWENSNDQIPTTAQDIYALIQNMNVAEGDSNNRQLASRSEYMVGYYGGAVGDSVSTSAYQLDQKVQIVNGEELYVEISYNYNGRVIEHINGDTKPFNVEVNIEGLTSGEIWPIDFDIKENFVVRNGRIMTGLLLDGMGANQDFATITAAANKNFIPGEDLKISVKTIYQYDSVKLKEQSDVYEVNSLFQDVTDHTVEVNGTSVLERVIGVSSVRHLRNLGEGYYSGNIVKYSNSQEIEAYTILQKNDIDFTKGTYVFEGADYVVENFFEDNAVPLSRPISHISPIQNAAIFEDGSKIVEVDGDEFAIKNLKVNATANNAGLFAKTKNVTFRNVKLEDFTLGAAGYDNVGALVGYAQGGRIEYSGVYLSPFYRNTSGNKQYYNQESDSAYGNKMAAHYAEMIVTGRDNVGGLVGKAEKTYITDSYSAVQVKGRATVGGLVGYIIGNINPSANVFEMDTEEEMLATVSLVNSYASGMVYASNKEVGGLIGYANNLCVNNAYATGDVRGNDEMAGFVGDSDHGYYKRCSSYGEVLNTSGTNTFTEGTVVGGFISLMDGNNGDVPSIGYLSQVGYNAADTVFDDTVLKKEYKNFTDVVSKTSAAKSFPYDGNLLFKAFPFTMVTDNHYGDWPSQYFINTSLVYYEKYADGTYGYYSVTKLTDTTEESETDKYVWVLDSLRDETCREDGYALLTMFYLDSVDYSVYQYVDNTDDNTDNGSWQYAKNSATDNTAIKGTLKVSDNDKAADAYGPNKMVRLVQQGALVFNAYEEVENPYSADYKGQPIKSSFTTNGMYLYQLPYELQNTYRYDVDNFYDVIVFDEGYAVGNLKSEVEGDVGGTPVIADEVYYYCPHFSKLAINPGLGVSESTSNFVKLEAPYTVEVRSARQLNCLGRVPYYWNDKGGGTDLITYNQEVDINFSTYADFGSGKTYCGRTYNLLAFDTEYANQPIGQRASDSGSYGAFQNDYNGNYHKIIDYCVKSENQYVGLFGEIYKANGATKAQIKNVVMMVSNPEHKANYLTESDEMKQNNAGLIIGNYQEKSNASGNNRQRTGVGALVGSDYTVGKAYTSDTLKQNEKNIIYTIHNCAATGYQVEYHITASKGNGYQQPLGIALGGMIGCSRGNIAHSTVSNDVKLVAETSLTGDTAAIMIGGFSGSSFCGTTLNCYAGGTIDVETKNNSQLTRLRIGGFCPGWLDAKGIEASDSNADVSYINIYSFTKVKDSVWNISETFNHFMPTVSRMRLYYEWRLFDGTKWHTDYENGSAAVSVPGFSYYLNTIITSDMLSKNSSDAKKYYEYQWSIGGTRPKTCDPATYTQLSDLTWVNSNNGVKFITTELYPTLTNADYVVSYSDEFVGKDYPFPAFVQDANGKYVHYGDWPLNE